MATDTPPVTTGADSVLTALKDAGVDYLFANAGTDFPPVIESLAAAAPGSVPTPVTAPHETAAVAMAHGFYLTTGRAQALMVHVNVGLANALMGVINAASDNVPMLVMSGRTPITERGRKGSRITPIQVGQEMFDQTSIVRDCTKYTYEMRYPEQGAPLVHRALAVARTAPEGPVYLSLPREPLAAEIPDGLHDPTPVPVPSPAAPDPATLARAVAACAAAERPVILVQRGDTAGRLAPAVAALAARLGTPVYEPFPVRNVLPSAAPALAGYAPGPVLKTADLILAIDCDIPWIEALHRPDRATPVIQIGPDPLFARMPVRGHKTDIALTGDAVATVTALATALPGPDRPFTHPDPAARRANARAVAEAGSTAPMTAEWMSACVSDIMDDRAVAFTELGLLPGFMDLKGPNRLFCNPHSGGLGWALPAALGAQLADRDRLVIACVGDGSYMFANPVACHQIAEALDLPVLTIVKNNATWNAVRRSVLKGYPQGAAVAANEMPLTSLSPIPDFASVARASRAHAETVTDGRDLPAALERAVHIIRSERRQVLLDLRVALSDDH